MVPVIDKNNNPLMPCSEKRARHLMEKKEAKPLWKKGIFCIKLLKNPSDSQKQEIALGIDPGSKREGYTVATAKAVVINLTSDTPEWIKEHVETRRNLRRSRRFRKTPYRKCRYNRSVPQGRIPPSTKGRWEAKLRIIKVLTEILPISIINIEDINAITKKGKKKWNISFSPLQVGKDYFDQKIKDLYPHIKLMKTFGFQTHTHRLLRNFPKSKKKLDYTWESHNVDSHCLAELALQTMIPESKGLYKINFLEYHRRQLHVQNPSKGGIRKPYGTSTSMKMRRGSVLLYKNKLCYLGGSSQGKIAIHSIISGKRVQQFVDPNKVKQLYNSSWRLQFLPRLKPWVSLQKFS